MAEVLKERHHLLALKVTFRYWTNPTEVVFDLERMVGERNMLDNRWRATACAIGAPDDVDGLSEIELTLPAGILDPLVEQVTAAARPGEPLWLHLVKPYGCLGAMDWEGVLGARLKRPLLRLPDFLEPPRAPRSALDVALVCDLPNDEPSFSIDQAVAAMVSWTAKSPRPVRYHVFASRAWREAVLDSVRANAPLVASVVAPEPPKEAQGWFNWIESSLSGVTLDAVHFLAPGWFSNQQPTLALTRSPCVSSAESTALFLTPREVSAFLGRSGAWACLFAIAPGAHRAPLRGFADALAQERPGPVFCHDLGHSGWREALDQWSSLLFSDTPIAAPAATGAAFAYCQPTQVEGASTPIWLEGHELSSFPSLNGAIGQSGEPERWVSGALRYGESLARQSAIASAPSPNSKRELRSEYERTVSRIDAIAARTASLKGET